MEAVAPTAASAGLHQLTLGVLASLDTWGGDSAVRALTDILDTAEEAEVASAPASIGAVLPLLAGSPDLLRAGLDLVTRLDLYEAADGLAVLIWRGHPAATLAGAALCAHPGVSSTFRDLVLAHGADLTSDWEQDLFHTRLDPEYMPKTDAGRADRAARWLPRDPFEASLAAVALEAPSPGFSARDQLRLALECVVAGVVVRRLPVGEQVDSAWLPGWVPTVGRTASARLRLDGPLSPPRITRVVAMARKVATHAWRPSVIGTTAEAPSRPELTSVDVFDDGSMPRPEVAYLAGLRNSQFSAIGKYENLRPQLYRGLAYWSFSQVVGLRTARYLFSISGRRTGMGAVADRLVGLTRRHVRVPVGVTEAGEILVKEGDNLYDLEHGQVVSEGIVSLVDRVYEPFTLEGATVPRLLRPTPRTEVHPSVAGGLPRIAGRRITVGALTKAFAAATSGGSTNPLDDVAADYGLEPAEVEEALGVDSGMRAAL